MLGGHGAEPRPFGVDDRPQVHEAQAQWRRCDEERRRRRDPLVRNIRRCTCPRTRDDRLVVDRHGDLVGGFTGPSRFAGQIEQRPRVVGAGAQAGDRRRIADDELGDPRDGPTIASNRWWISRSARCPAAASLAPNHHSSSAPPPIATSAVAMIPPASSRRQLTWRSRTSMEGTRQAEYRKGKLRRGGVAGPQSDAQTRRARRRGELAPRRGAVRRRIDAQGPARRAGRRRHLPGRAAPRRQRRRTPGRRFARDRRPGLRRDAPERSRARRLLDRLHHRPARWIGADVHHQGRDRVAPRRRRSAGRPARAAAGERARRAARQHRGDRPVPRRVPASLAAIFAARRLPAGGLRGDRARCISPSSSAATRSSATPACSSAGRLRRRSPRAS